jgi:cytochrome c-type biogenesis protein
MISDISLAAAFVAGLLSITSPCVLPLIPLYLAHLAGVGIGEGGLAGRTRVMVNAVAFALGFSAVFVLLGASIRAAGGFVADGRVWLVRIGGALLVLMGAHLIGLLRISLLDREYRVDVKTSASGVGRAASSLAVGAAFGAGWTPCVGPILGAILTLAAGQGDPRDASVLLAVFAAGFAVPFLAAAGAAFGTAPRVIRSLTGRLATLHSLSGAVILAIGVVLLLGIYEQLFAELAGLAPWRPWEPNV